MRAKAAPFTEPVRWPVLQAVGDAPALRSRSRDETSRHGPDQAASAQRLFYVPSRGDRMRRSMREFVITVVLCVAPAAWAQSQHDHGAAGDGPPSAPTARDASFGA